MSYTYYIYHIPTNQHYYGARWAKNSQPDDLWVTYFTSSKEVKRLIEEYGVDSFQIKIRRTFQTAAEARTWEHRVLKRLKVSKRKDWLNKTNGQPPICDYSRVGQGLGRTLSEHHRKRISEGRTGIKRTPFSEQCRKNLSEAHKGYIHSDAAKRNMCSAQRSSKPKYTFTCGDDIFVGCMIEWAEQYCLNVKSAATVFCLNKQYKGWSRMRA